MLIHNLLKSIEFRLLFKIFIENLCIYIDKFSRSNSNDNLAMEENLRQVDENYNNILEQNKRMIYSIINEIKATGFDLEYQVSDDDLFQEGCIALYDACQSFRDCGAKFSTFAYIVIKRRIKHKYHEFVRPLIHERYSYDAVRQVDYYSNYAIKDMHDESINKDLVDGFMKTLDKVDAQIIMLRQNNIPYKSISQITNLNVKQIDYRIRKTKNKYRAYLLKNGLN